MKKRKLVLSTLLSMAFGIGAFSMPAEAAGLPNKGVMSGTGTNAIDVDNQEKGVIISGNYTKTVTNAGLLAGGTFANIVDNGGNYGLQLNLSSLVVSNLSYTGTEDYNHNNGTYADGVYTYNNISYLVMPYNTQYTFTLSATGGLHLPDSITIQQKGADLTAGTDYTYDSSSGQVSISASLINYPMTLTASATDHVHVYNQEIAEDQYKQSDATCEKAAVYYKSCTCGRAGAETFTSGSPLGHDAGESAWVTDSNSHWHECIRCQAKIDEEEHQLRWVTDKEPTETEAGERHQECSVCGYKTEGEEIPATGAGSGNTETPSGQNGNQGTATGTNASKSTGTVNTGDNMNTGFWLSLLTVSGLALIAALVLQVKKRI